MQRFPEAALTVALAAPKEYIQALRVVAARRNVRVADITRFACDTVFGDEILREISLQNGSESDSDSSVAHKHD